jgi:hypothetical protein
MPAERDNVNLAQIGKMKQIDGSCTADQRNWQRFPFVSEKTAHTQELLTCYHWQKQSGYTIGA